jgi:hypothetical protein
MFALWADYVNSGLRLKWQQEKPWNLAPLKAYFLLFSMKAFLSFYFGN